jgi:hypothetical protein
MTDAGTSKTYSVQYQGGPENENHRHLKKLVKRKKSPDDTLNTLKTLNTPAELTLLRFIRFCPSLLHMADEGFRHGEYTG